MTCRAQQDAHSGLAGPVAFGTRLRWPGMYARSAMFSSILKAHTKMERIYKKGPPKDREQVQSGLLGLYVVEACFCPLQDFFSNLRRAFAPCNDFKSEIWTVLGEGSKSFISKLRAECPCNSNLCISCNALQIATPRSQHTSQIC